MSRLPIEKLALFGPPYRLYDAPFRAGERPIWGVRCDDGRRLLGQRDRILHGRDDRPSARRRRPRRTQPFWEVLEALAPTLAYDTLVMGNASLPTARAAALAVPTLVNDGDANFDVMDETADALAAALPTGPHTLAWQTTWSARRCSSPCCGSLSWARTAASRQPERRPAGPLGHPGVMTATHAGGAGVESGPRRSTIA